MLPRKLYTYIIGVCVGLFISPFCHGRIEAKEFVVVIDAGHGGNDPGAIGKTSKEKDINLNVALKLGRLIRDNCPDTKVVYTRQKDVFIPLGRRADIANEAKADLFISIHTNSLPKGKSSVSGASTWTLGLAKSDANLEVAKRENSVILYESDYKTRYAGFNPNSAESYIIFEFMQDKYMSQSVHLASLVQQEFKTTARRPDRGVHQAGFLVLKASAMPSILVELGFISNPAEERYMNSNEGRTALANCIYRAFLRYKREQEIRQDGASETVVPEEQPAETAVSSESRHDEQQRPPVVKEPIVVFKLQIATSSQRYKSTDKRWKGLKNVTYYQEGGVYKYTYGETTDYDQIVKMKKEITARFKDAFVVAFKNGKKVDLQEAIKESKQKK
ncbi:MAG: N-acetylmuramoyl-L-alanine amidase [Mediterranea sp.]|jgi:N-acetylmuramoyl-L-alanine amidase|nr:N-acetylmuramoyl-L-alanine amidase [Mediterranea sp.]